MPGELRCVVVWELPQGAGFSAYGVTPHLTEGSRAFYKGKTLEQMRFMASALWPDVAIRKRYNDCLVCGKESFDRYMVQEEVWRDEALLRGEGVCHLECLESHLGRTLRLEDFTPAPINAVVRFGYTRAHQPAASTTEEQGRTRALEVENARLGSLLQRHVYLANAAKRLVRAAGDPVLLGHRVLDLELELQGTPGTVSSKPVPREELLLDIAATVALDPR